MSDMYIPSAIRVPESRNVGTYNTGGPFRGGQHSTEPLGNWKLGAKTGPAIHSTAESAKRWFQGFKSPYNILCCFSELNSHNYFRRGKKKFQRDLDTGPLRAGFDATFQRRPLDMMAWSLSGQSTCGYPSNYVSEFTPQVSVEGCAADVHSWEDSVYRKLSQVWYEIFVVLIDAKAIAADVLMKPYRSKGIGGAAAGPDGKGRMTVQEWLTATRLTDGEAWNICAHSDMPGRNKYSGKSKPGQTHWDLPLDFEKLAYYVNQKLSGSGAAGAPSKHTQADLISSATAPAAPKPDVTVPTSTFNLGDLTSATYSVPVEQTTVRPQQRGQSIHHLEQAAKEINTAIKLLTPKPKGKKKK